MGCRRASTADEAILYCKNGNGARMISPEDVRKRPTPLTRSEARRRYAPSFSRDRKSKLGGVSFETTVKSSYDLSSLTREFGRWVDAAPSGDHQQCLVSAWGLRPYSCCSA
jgi:hypothetical protein